MKFSKVDTAIKVNVSSSWIIYITKNHKDAEDIHRFAMTQKARKLLCAVFSAL